MRASEIIALVDEIDRRMAAYVADEDAEIPDIAEITAAIRRTLAQPGTLIVHSSTILGVRFEAAGALYECFVDDGRDVADIFLLEATEGGDMTLESSSVQNFEQAAALVREWSGR